MKTIASFVVSIAFALIVVDAAPEGPPACNSLKPATIDYKELNRLSPFYLYRSTTSIFNCSLINFVGPVGDRTDYTGTSHVLQGDYTFSYHINIVNNSLFDAYLCSTGVKGLFQTVYSNFKAGKASFCVVVCNLEDGTKYDAVICLGRTPADDSDGKRFLRTTLKGVTGVQNMQSSSCPKPQHCDVFTNK